jgi:hypothetical protein
MCALNSDDHTNTLLSLLLFLMLHVPVTPTNLQGKHNIHHNFLVSLFQYTEY